MYIERGFYFPINTSLRVGLQTRPLVLKLSQYVKKKLAEIIKKRRLSPLKIFLL